MRHRIFIAVNLPEDVKKDLVSYQSNWPELPIRWTKKENLHITLVFFGYLTDQEVSELCQRTKEVASEHKPSSIKLKRIYYGPPKKMPPRMVWAEGERSEELAQLQKDLEGEKSEARPYHPHITLGRIITWEWRRLEPEERPEVDREIDLEFEVNSVEVMESVLKRGGAEYIILESCPLKN